MTVYLLVHLPITNVKLKPDMYILISNIDVGPCMTWAMAHLQGHLLFDKCLGEFKINSSKYLPHQIA